MAHNELSIADVEHLAVLSRLELSDEQLKRFQKELNSVFEVMDILQEVDTDGLDETAQVTGLVNVVREDKAGKMLSIGEVLSNAPKRKGRNFNVPDVL